MEFVFKEFTVEYKNCNKITVRTIQPFLPLFHLKQMDTSEPISRPPRTSPILSCWKSATQHEALQSNRVSESHLMKRRDKKRKFVEKE